MELLSMVLAFCLLTLFPVLGTPTTCEKPSLSWSISQEDTDLAFHSKVLVNVKVRVACQKAAWSGQPLFVKLGDDYYLLGRIAESKSFATAIYFGDSSLGKKHNFKIVTVLSGEEKILSETAQYILKKQWKPPISSAVDLLMGILPGITWWFTVKKAFSKYIN